MLVQELPLEACEKFVAISDHSELIEAARLLREGTDLVVVCGAGGAAVGVITKTNIVDEISRC